IDQETKGLLLMPLIDTGLRCRREIAKQRADLSSGVFGTTLPLGPQRVFGTTAECFMVHRHPCEARHRLCSTRAPCAPVCRIVRANRRVGPDPKARPRWRALSAP